MKKYPAKSELQLATDILKNHPEFHSLLLSLVRQILTPLVSLTASQIIRKDNKGDLTLGTINKIKRLYNKNSPKAFISLTTQTISKITAFELSHKLLQKYIYQSYRHRKEELLSCISSITYKDLAHYFLISHDKATVIKRERRLHEVHNHKLSTLVTIEFGYQKLINR